MKALILLTVLTAVIVTALVVIDLIDRGFISFA